HRAARDRRDHARRIALRSLPRRAPRPRRAARRSAPADPGDVPARRRRARARRGEPAGRPEGAAPPVSEAPRIELVDLGVRFGDVVAVDGVSLSVADGEVVTLLGGSGSGKTTTLNAINRLVEPTSGVVRVAGQDTRAIAPHLLRRR